MLEDGPVSIESEYDEALALPGIIKQVVIAESERMDAIIINCASDPGIDAAREVASIPVIGPAQAAFFLSTMLAQKFSVIAILERDIPDLDRMFRVYGILDRIASVRVMNIPVLDLFKDRNKAIDAMTKAALLALKEDRAEAITFDCTGLTGIVDDVKSNLSKEGFDVPVIEPVASSLKLAETLVDLGISHSKITYPIPPKKS
jgi:allantoin racemase|tara:strand:+ start:402 stop:1010 length:609 start_codon:yes stop_codon:yes gene_type:complete